MNQAPASVKANKAHITVAGLIIDKHTGEILDRPSVFDGVVEYQSELSKCRSVDDFQYHLRLPDLRKLPAHKLHSLRDEVDRALGEYRRSGIDCRINIPQQRLLEKLHGLTLYRNVIFMTQTALAKALGVDESNLMKKLKVLEGANMLRISTSRNGNIRKGEVKLAINPRFVFRGGGFMRNRYVEDWYRPDGYLHMGTLRLPSAEECLALAA